MKAKTIWRPPSIKATLLRLSPVDALVGDERLRR